MKIYIASIEPFSQLPGMELLSHARRGQLEKYNKTEDKQRCLVAGLLLRYALGEAVENIAYGKNGKPYISGGPYFNLSHSGDYVVLGVSGCELGLDIQLMGEYKDKLARRCCTDGEYEWLKTQQPEAFYRMWAGKESVMKLTGLGFVLPAGSFSVLPLSNGTYHVKDKFWHLKWLDILPAYALCVATEQEEEQEIVFLSREELLS